MCHVGFFMILLLFTFDLYGNEGECKSWFKKVGLKKGESCLIECAITQVDMGTFHCYEMCNKLCRISLQKQFVFGLSELYPGLRSCLKSLLNR